MTTASGKIRQHLKLVAGLVGLAVVIIWSGGFLMAKTQPGKMDNPPGDALPADANVLEVRLESVPVRVEAIGTTASEEKINLSARIPAYVRQVHASAGDHVKKGQQLIALDDRDIRQKLAAAEAQLNHAQAEYDRAKKLFEQQAATQQALTAAESMFTAAKAQVEEVKVMLTYAQVESPIDGIVTERRVEAGDFAAPGMLLLAVYDPARMRLEAPVPLRLIDYLTLNQELEVLLERPQRVFNGKVTEIVSEVDASSRTQLVKVRLEGVDGDVLPGVFGRLWVATPPRMAIFVPESAVIRIGQLAYVQIVRAERAVRRMVKTGPVQDGRVEILAGLEAGDLVIVNPTRKD